MIKLWHENTTEMNSKEFELFIKNLFESANEKLHNLKIVHNEKIQNHDGTYQIDITTRFRAFGGEFLILIECKHHKNPIKRETVQALHDKVQTIGAQKGMIFSTIGFLKGAIKYASQHGIALVRIDDGKTTYITRSIDNITHEPPTWAHIPKYIGWLIKENREGAINMSTISEERIEGLLNYLEEE